MTETVEAKHTAGPWKVEATIYEHCVCEVVGERGIAPVWSGPNAWHDASLMAAAPDLLVSAKNAAATISAIYQWLDRVESAGGAKSISGVAACHAMLTSLRKNADRTEKLVMEPLRAAIAKAEAR